MTRIGLWLCAALLTAGAAHAQLALPGAAGDAGGAEAPAPAPKPHVRRAAPTPKLAAAGPDSVVGKTLRLNGRDGELTLARGDDKTLKVTKFSLMGEVISHPAQACKIDIVADKPIEAAPKGEPDGLPRYGADIPACPLTFDVVDGAALVPAQANACVFTAADCQASPSGLWGPSAAELDARSVQKSRAAADRAIQDSLRDLEKRDKDAAASLSREQSDFAAERDDTCRDYAGETRLGFCAAQLAQTRAALLAQRVAEAGPAHATAPERKRRRKKAE
jgi:hypothetical protein